MVRQRTSRMSNGSDSEALLSSHLCRANAGLALVQVWPALLQASYQTPRTVVRHHNAGSWRGWART